MDEAILHGNLTGIDIALVVSNNSSSGAITYANQRGLRVRHISIRVCGDEERATKAMLTELEDAKIDWIFLAGYMRLIPGAVIARYENRILNTHPALLPSFGGEGMYGVNVHHAVLARGCKVSGATIHFVTSKFDEGPILLQQCCAVEEGDTTDELQARVQKVEKGLVVKALQLVANDKITVKEGRVIIDP